MTLTSLDIISMTFSSFKPITSAKALMPSAEYQLPYEGAKERLLVEDIENRDFVKELFEAMYNELPEPKKRK